VVIFKILMRATEAKKKGTKKAFTDAHQTSQNLAIKELVLHEPPTISNGHSALERGSDAVCIQSEPPTWAMQLHQRQRTHRTPFDQ
jgi:type IV secretory pathway TrbL component